MFKPPLQNTSAPRDQEPDAEVQKILEWHAKRRERLLRGEYESQVLRLSELMNQNLETPMRIGAVRVEGATNTRKSFLASLIDPVLAQQANTLEEVLHTTRRISQTLQKANLFKHVEAKLESSRQPLASPEDVDIVFKTRELGRYYLNTSTELGNNEGTASATARIRNVFGGGETFEANMSAGTKTKKSFRGAFSFPLSSDLRTYGEILAFGLERDHTSYASCIEDAKGFKAIVRNGSHNEGYHELAYEVVHRYLGNLAPTASMSMRSAAGPSTKSALSLTYVRDTRDDQIAATRGFYFRLFQEIAGAGANIPLRSDTSTATTAQTPSAPMSIGLGGDASFYKAEAETQMSRQIVDGVSMSVALRSGILLGLSDRPVAPFPDRFQIGGPTSVRAFKSFGMGPRDGPDSLGGDIFYSLGLSLVTNIPRKPHWPVKTHAWINAGQLDSLNYGKWKTPYQVRACIMTQNAFTDKSSRFIPPTLSRPSISAGLGIIYRFDPIRLEVNIGMPLTANKSDVLRRGIQVGMGLEFL